MDWNTNSDLQNKMLGNMNTTETWTGLRALEG